ncbi:hypothetical protein [Variovorax rhizosphaerae]|uniref:DUF4189 domain-containing protein n=1 Tax=Variovorax rhizosphaerae TaxID=1836200 RepID=A0ABU8WWJ2_9BURK
MKLQREDVVVRIVLWIGACALPMMVYLNIRDRMASRDALRAAQDWSVSGDAIGTSDLIVDAHQACNLLGLSFIDCASLPEPLGYQIGAGAIAASAVARREEYFERCKANYRIDSCSEVLNRAVRICQAMRRTEYRGLAGHRGESSPRTIQ